MDRNLIIIIDDTNNDIEHDKITNLCDVAYIGNVVTTQYKYVLNIEYKLNKWYLIKKFFKKFDIVDKYDYFWFVDFNYDIIPNIEKVFKQIQGYDLGKPQIIYDHMDEIMKISEKELCFDNIIVNKQKYDKKIINYILQNIITLPNSNFIDLELPILSQKLLKQMMKYILDLTKIDYGFGLDSIWNIITKNKIIMDVKINYIAHGKKMTDFSHDEISEQRKKMLRQYNFIRKYLLIVPTGDGTYHDFDDDTRNFDVCIIYYNDDKEEYFKKQCEYFFKIKGPKWKLIKLILPYLTWQYYDYIWIPDDDLVISIDKINLMFSDADANNLSLSQPSVAIPDLEFKQVQKILGLLDNDKDLYTYVSLYNLRKKYPEKEDIINTILYRVSYPILIRKYKEHTIRPVDFIEIQMPLFNIKLFKKLYEYIIDDVVETGFGLDKLWSTIVKNKFVIDYIEVLHMRDTGFSKYEKYKKGKLKIEDVPEQYRNLKDSPRNEEYNLLHKFLRNDVIATLSNE
jgi:hypothetical protein